MGLAELVAVDHLAWNTWCSGDLMKSIKQQEKLCGVPFVMIKQ